MDYSCKKKKKLIDVLVLNFKAMFSAQVRVGKKDSYIVLAGKQQRCCDRAPFKLLRRWLEQAILEPARRWMPWQFATSV